MPNNEDDTSGDKSTQAQSRLSKLSSQISPSDNSSQTRPRQRRRQKSTSGPPANYSDVLTQLSTLREIASTPPTSSRGYIRQKQAGKLWVRERVTSLFDKDSVREVGSVAGSVTWEKKTMKEAEGSFEGEKPASFTPSNSVQGFACLRKRRVVFSADDYSLRAGHADGAIWAKTLYVEKLALELKLPIVKLVDGSSGGGSVTTIRTNGFSYVPPLVGFDVVVRQLNSGIPNVGAVLGPAIGLGAARVTLCHFSVMAGGGVGSLFNAGPKVVAGATFEEGLTPAELGGPDMHCRNGTIDNLAADEEAAFEQLRVVLSFLPDCGDMSLPPVVQSEDAPARKDESLRSVIPRNRNRAYDARKIITTLVDRNSWFEIGGLWGTTVIVGLARFDGHPVGIVANNPEVQAGALDAAGSQKLTKHLKLCDVMNLPVVQLVDVPGYAVGTVAERSATMRHGATLAATYYATSTPIFSVITRKCYGVAGGAMVDSRDPHVRVGWPSGDWGSLPLAGGIEASHSHELKQAAEKGGEAAAKKLYAELEAEYTRLMNPVRSANSFSIEEIIDPADTRGVLCEWVRLCYTRVLLERLDARKAGRLRAAYF